MCLTLQNWDNGIWLLLISIVFFFDNKPITNRGRLFVTAWNIHLYDSSFKSSRKLVLGSAAHLNINEVFGWIFLLFTFHIIPLLTLAHTVTTTMFYLILLTVKHPHEHTVYVHIMYSCSEVWINYVLLTSAVYYYNVKEHWNLQCKKVFFSTSSQ